MPRGYGLDPQTSVNEDATERLVSDFRSGLRRPKKARAKLHKRPIAKAARKKRRATVPDAKAPRQDGLTKTYRPSWAMAQDEVRAQTHRSRKGRHKPAARP